MDESQFKSFVYNVRLKTNKLLGDTHHDRDVMENLKDLLEVLRLMELKNEDKSGQSSQMRLLKRDLEAARSKSRTLEREIEEFEKNVFPKMIFNLQMITRSANLIGVALKSDEYDPSDVKKALDSIRGSASKITEALKMIPSPPQNQED